MKVKKAAKRLSRVETLLSGVLNAYAADEAELREPLQVAVAAVKRARSAIDSNQSSGNPQTAAKTGRTARKADRRNVESSKKISLTRKKSSATANVKGTRTATGSTVSQGKFSRRKSGSADAAKRIGERSKSQRADQRTTRKNQPNIAQQNLRTAKEAAPTDVPAKQVPVSEGTTHAVSV